MSTPRFLDLPPDVRREDIQTSRGTFAVLEALPGSGVPERCPALLVPGYTGSKEDYIAVLHTLAQAGRRRVMAVDMRGQYETPGPDDQSAYTCAVLAADIDALLDELGPDQVHLVGHSFGGLVCREKVLTDSGRLASLTMMSSGPAAVTGTTADNARALRQALSQFGPEQIWTLKMGPDAHANGTSTEIIEFLRRRMLKNSVPGLIGMAQELLSCADRVDELAKAVRDAALPVLVLYGEEDYVWSPSVQAEMAERLDASRIVIPGAAHSPAVEAPETTASALTDFWNIAERNSR